MTLNLALLRFTFSKVQLRLALTVGTVLGGQGEGEGLGLFSAASVVSEGSQPPSDGDLELEIEPSAIVGESGDERMVGVVIVVLVLLTCVFVFYERVY